MLEDGFAWEWEVDAVWDQNKEWVISTKKNAFNLDCLEIGGSLPGIWGYLKNEEDKIIGYGWITLNKNEPEISIAIEDSFQGKEIGGEILEILEDETKSRGYTSVVAIVKDTNVLAPEIVDWMYKKGFLATNFVHPVGVELALKLIEKSQDVNLLKKLD